MQWNGVRRAHSIWCKRLTNNTHLHHPSIPVSHFFTMSSLEEPLSFDKLPSMSTMDRIQRFSSGACRPRDDVGMGHRWIEGRDCTTSNSCMWVWKYISIFVFLSYDNFLFLMLLKCMLTYSDDDKSFAKESFPWRRHTRKLSEGEHMFRNISFAGRTSTVSGTLRESKSFKEQKYSTFSNENGTSHISNKVIVSMEESSFWPLYKTYPQIPRSPSM